MLHMCEVSQDLRRFHAVALVLRTDQDNLTSLKPLKHMPFCFAVALAIRDSSILYFIDTAETLAFKAVVFFAIWRLLLLELFF